MDEREIDLNKFMTVDSVGEIDVDVMDADVDAMVTEAENNLKSTDEETRKRGLIGPEYIKSIEAFYCELCNHYSGKVGDISLEDYTKKHCLTHSHVKAFLRQKDEIEKKNKSLEADDQEDDQEGDEKRGADDEAEPDEEIDAKIDEDEDDDEEEYGDGDHADDANDDNMWEAVDKDLGDLLAEVDQEEEEEEDESVLNIDIER